MSWLRKSACSPVGYRRKAESSASWKTSCGIERAAPPAGRRSHGATYRPGPRRTQSCADPNYPHETSSRTPTSQVIPNSRAPLACLEVRLKIETIEPEARRLGWPAELLWNAGFWDSPRGLAAVVDSGDEIIEVACDFIKILKTRRDLLRFQRRV
jgi:hypothetical protein